MSIFYPRKNQHRQYRKTVCGLMSVCLIFSVIASPLSAWAQTLPANPLNLPPVGTMVAMSPAYTPAIIKGITVHPDNPLQFNFIVDTGDSELAGEALKSESTRLIKYFLSTITIPENDLWVNLSPEEKDNIIPESFGETEMGRDLLAQDYILKQLTASLMYPEKELGKTFWARVRQTAKQKYGTEDIPMDSINKVWVVPEKAVIYEHQGSAYVIDSRLKVMMEEEYLASHPDRATQKGEEAAADRTHLTSAMIKNIIVPEIEKEVNQGQTFARLRQVYHSMILASWYKEALKESLLSKLYADKNLIKGVDVQDRNVKQKIYQQYMEAFKEGVYNYIREDFDASTGEVILRRYASGGAAMKITPVKQVITGSPDRLNDTDFAMVAQGLAPSSEKSRLINLEVTVVENIPQPALAGISSGEPLSIADAIQQKMAAAGQNTLKLRRIMPGQTVITGPTVSMINRDITQPLVVEPLDDEFILAYRIPDMAQKLSAMAVREMQPLMTPLQTIQKQIQAMKTATDAQEYNLAFSRIPPQIMRLSHLMDMMTYHYPELVAGSLAEEKMRQAEQALKETIRFYVAEHMLAYFLSPDIQPFAKPWAEKQKDFLQVEQNISQIYAFADRLSRLNRVPEKNPQGSLLKLEDLMEATRGDDHAMATDARQSAALTVSRLIPQGETIRTFTQEEEQTLLSGLNPEMISALNQDITVPLVLWRNPDGSLAVQKIPEDEVIAGVQDHAQRRQAQIQPLMTRLITLISNLRQKKSGETEPSLYREMDDLYEQLKEVLDALSASEDIPPAPTAKEDKLARIKNTLDQTLKHYITKEIILSENNIPAAEFTKSARTLRYFKTDTIFKAALTIEQLADHFTDIRALPELSADQTIFDLSELIDTIKDSHTDKMANAIIEDILLHNSKVLPNLLLINNEQATLLGLNNGGRIKRINQDISKPLWLSQTHNNMINALYLANMLPAIKATTQEITAPFMSPLAQIKARIQEMKTADDPQTYEDAFDQIETNIHEISQLLTTLDPHLPENKAVAIDSAETKITAATQMARNTLKHFISNKIAPVMVLDPFLTGFEDPEEQKQTAFETAERALREVNATIDILLELKGIPEEQGTDRVFDITEQITRRARQDHAMSAHRNIAEAIQDLPGIMDKHMPLSAETVRMLGLTDDIIQKINADLTLPVWITGTVETGVYAQAGFMIPRHFEMIGRQSLSEVMGDFYNIIREMNIMLKAKSEKPYQAAFKKLTEFTASMENKIAALSIPFADMPAPGSLQEKAGKILAFYRNSIPYYFGNSLDTSLIDPQNLPVKTPRPAKEEAFKKFNHQLIRKSSRFHKLLNISYLPEAIEDMGILDLSRHLGSDTQSPQDFAMVSTQTIQKAVKQGIFEFPVIDFLSEDNPELGTIKRRIQATQANGDIPGFYRELIGFRDYLNRMTPNQSFQLGGLTVKIRHIQDFAEEHAIALTQPAQDQAPDDEAMLSYELQQKALTQGLFTFNYPRVIGKEKALVLTLKEKALAAQQGTDLIELYKTFIALRKAVGAANSRGRPYQYLTRRIQKIEQFARDNDLTLPDRSGIRPEDYAMTADIPEIAEILGVETGLIKLALKLAAQNLPYTFYQYYNVVLEDGLLNTITLNDIDADIFINTIAGESFFHLQDEAIVDALEKAGLWVTIADNWRANRKEILKQIEEGDTDSWGFPTDQISLPFSGDLTTDEAMRVSAQAQRTARLLGIDQQVVERALLLAFARTAYDVYERYNPALDRPLEDVDLEDTNPFIFIDTLIHRGELELSEDALVNFLEEKGLFLELTGQFREYQKVLQENIEEGVSALFNPRGPLLEDNAMSTAAMTSFYVEQTITELIQITAIKERVLKTRPENGLITADLGKRLQKTPGEWERFFNARLKIKQQELSRLLIKERLLTKMAPTQADSDTSALMEAFAQGYFLTPMQEAFSQNQKIYQMYRGEPDIAAQLYRMHEKMPNIKTNLWVHSAHQKILFAEALNFAALFESLHIITYSDGSINAVLVPRANTNKDFSMGTRDNVNAYVTVNNLQDYLDGAKITANNHKQYTLISRVDFQREQNTYFVDIDILGDITTKPVRAARFKIKGSHVFDFNMNLSRLRLDDTGETTDLSRTDLSAKILEKIAKILSPADMGLLLATMEQSVEQLPQQGWFISHYDPSALSTTHFYEGTRQRKGQLTVPGDERHLTHAQILERHGEEQFYSNRDDSAMTVYPSILNMRVEQSFERLTELNLERYRMLLSARKNGNQEVVMRHLGQILFNTPEGWAKHYEEQLRNERAFYNRLQSQREAQEENQPTDADQDLEALSSTLLEARFKTLKETEILHQAKQHEIIDTHTDGFDFLRTLRRNLVRQKVNLFTPGLGRTNFTDIFDRLRYPNEKILNVHILYYADGSQNVVIFFKPVPSALDDTAMTAQQRINQKVLASHEPGEDLIRALGQEGITVPRLKALLEAPITIDLAESRTFLPRDWKQILGRFAVNTSESLAFDFRYDALELILKWSNPATNSEALFNKAVFLIFDSGIPVAQKAAEVVLTADNFYKMMAALLENGRAAEALRMVRFLESKVNGTWDNSAPGDEAMASNTKPGVMAVYSDSALRQQIYSQLNRSGGVNVYEAATRAEALRMIARDVVPTVVLTDDAGFAQELQTAAPSVSVFAYSSQDPLTMEGPNVIGRAHSARVPVTELSSLIRQTLFRINSEAEYGGIDFTRGRLNLEIRRDGKGVPLPLSNQPLENMRIEGFFPVIINVTPVSNLPLLLGIKSNDRLYFSKKIE